MGYFLININIRGDGRTKLSFIEYFWLKIALILREFGFPLEKLAIVQRCLFNPHLDPRKEYDADYHRKYYRDKGHLDSSTMLGVAIAMMLMTKEPVSIIIPPDGMAYAMKSFNVNPHNHPFMSIPLMGVLKRFMEDTENIERLSTIGVLNEQEAHILKQIRREDVREIKIEYANGKTKMLEVTAQKKALVEQELRLMISRYAYEHILLEKHGDKAMYVVKTKHKLG